MTSEKRMNVAREILGILVGVCETPEEAAEVCALVYLAMFKALDERHDQDNPC